MAHETLRQKQSRLLRYLALLIQYAEQQGYELTGGELWRTSEQAKLNAAKGIGTATSLHLDRLAIDLNLFRNGKWLTKSEDHKPLGEYWESLHPDCRWGGRFNDGNHYALSPDGKRA
jgi:hypothetical protein